MKLVAIFGIWGKFHHSDATAKSGKAQEIVYSSLWSEAIIVILSIITITIIIGIIVDDTFEV